MGWFAIFTLSAAALAYGLVLYPLWIAAWARLRGRPWRMAKPDEPVPFVSFIVPVYNEEAVLAAKIENCLALDYPADRIEFIFALDGCTDRSFEIVTAARDPRIRVLSFPVNRGKAALLNDVIAGARGEIVVLSDASARVNPPALRELVAPFADPEVAAVSGVYRVGRAERTALDSAEHSYLGFEMRLRIWEALARTTLSGTGALLAFRKEEFEPYPPGLINDDYVLPARLALRGRRVVCAPRAHVTELASTRPAAVFRRRVRIAYGNWQQLAVLKPLLNPRRGFVSWVFLSHKMFRMLMPFFVLALVGSAMMWDDALAQWLGWALCAAATLGAVGLALDRWFPDFNPLSVFALLFIHFAAVFVGTARYLLGRRVSW